jgi:tetratricopeptide (TPR) repeat protein
MRMDNDTSSEVLATGSATNEIERILADVEKEIDADHYERAMEILHYALRRPEFDLRVYEKAAFVLRMNGNHEAAELFEKVLEDPQDPEGYFRLGYQLVQEGVYGSALGPLSRCAQLAPDAPAAKYEFAYALMKEFYNEEALHFFIKAYEQEQAVSMLFYITQLLIFLGKSGEAALFARRLEEQVKESGEGEQQLDYIKGMLRRYRTHKAANIRDWHFVQYGTLLLRMFEEDEPEAAPNSSNGRYVIVNFSYDQVAAVLAAFQSAIDTIGVFPQYGYIAAAGEASEPIAVALGNMLALPVTSLTAGLSSGQKGIVIASFSDELAGIAADVWERDDILLFSFALSWTQESSVLPEAIGYLAQYPRLPWQERVVLGEDGQPVVVPKDERTAEDIAVHILDRVPHCDRKWISKLCDYYKERREEILAGSQIDVPRKKFFLHSALGGARY